MGHGMQSPLSPATAHDGSTASAQRCQTRRHPWQRFQDSSTRQRQVQCDGIRQVRRRCSFALGFKSCSKAPELGVDQVSDEVDTIEASVDSEQGGIVVSRSCRVVPS